jgi:hypothetical protein
MPLPTNINSAAALYALMTTSDTADLAQTYIQTANIDMSNYPSPAESVAHAVGSTFYTFSGIYDGGNYTITIGNVVSTYTGLFDTLAKPISGSGGIVKNINLIYQNTISNILVTDTWGGLVGEMAVCSIDNCSVTINELLSITLNQIDSDIGVICGFMGQNSSITNTRLIINNTIQLEGKNSSNVGLLCGQNSNSSITNCSITTASTAFDISLKTGQSLDSVTGLICGGVYDSLTAIDTAFLENITVNLNNNGLIIIDNISAPDPPTPIGAFCGTINGDGSPTPIIVRNCTININNNQELEGEFNIFFGSVTNVEVQNCLYNYITEYGNSSEIITINPAPPVNTSLVYTGSYTNVYSLASGGNYYTPDNSITILLGSQSITLIKSIEGIVINGTFQPVGTTYSSFTPQYTYDISVKGVGSMYFGFSYDQISNSSAAADQAAPECACEINNCATKSYTGITANSIITNAVEDKTIRANVNRQFATKSVVYPKFKSYSEYMKYLQAGLR